jgi:hypothetical protein
VIIAANIAVEVRRRICSPEAAVVFVVVVLVLLLMIVPPKDVIKF